MVNWDRDEGHRLLLKDNETLDLSLLCCRLLANSGRGKAASIASQHFGFLLFPYVKWQFYLENIQICTKVNVFSPFFTLSWMHKRMEIITINCLCSKNHSIYAT